MKYIDTHAHYDHWRYEGEKRKELLERLSKEESIEYVINATIGIASIGKMRNCLSDCQKILFTVGNHPTSAAKDGEITPDSKSIIERFLSDGRTVAIGETGIDTYRCTDIQEIENQKKWFRYFIGLSERTKKPLILHIRGKNAYKTAIRILEENNNAKHLSGVFHCFCEDYRTFKKCKKLKNFYFGIGGAVTKDRENSEKLRKAVKKMPLDRIILETDCPFLTPEGSNETLNSSFSIPVVIETIAQLKGISAQEVAEAAYNNSIKLFKLDK